MEKEDVLKWQEEKLSDEEKIYGNKLLLKFMDFDCDKSDKWIINCSLYDRSYDELLKVAFKISKFEYPPEFEGQINKEVYMYNELTLSEIANLPNFYRKTVHIVRSILREKEKGN